MPDDGTKPVGTVDEPVVEPTPTPATPPANVTTPPVSPGTDWEKSYKGLQRNYDKIVAQNATLSSEVETLTALVEEQKQTIRSATTEKDQVTTKNVEATETISGLEAQVNVAKAQADRSKLIMSEFIDLAQFEAKGLLPEAQTDDDMRAKFSTFREALGETVQKNTDKKLKGIGSGSTEPKEPTPENADQLYNKMIQLAGTKDPEKRREYEQLSARYLALQEDE